MNQALPRRTALLMVVVVLLAVGCTGKGPGSAPDEGETLVGESGFTLASGGVTLSGPAGVAPSGTEVIAEEISAPAELADLGLGGSPVLDISLAGGQQPQQPVTLTWPIPDDVPSDAVAFITSDGPGQPWRGVPVTVVGDQAQVQVDHLSLMAFVDGFDLINGVYDATMAFLGQRHATPEPCSQTVSVNGSGIALKNSRSDYVHACLEVEGDKILVTVASNSPYVFPIKVQKFASVRAPGPRTSTEAIVTAAVAEGIHRDTYPGFVLQGDRVEIEYALTDLIANPDNLEVAAGSFDQALALVGVAVVGVEMLVPGSRFEDVMDLAAAAECVGAVPGIMDSKTSTDAGASIPKIMDCLVTGMSTDSPVGGQLSAGVAVIGSLSGALINQFRGLGDQLSGSGFLVTTTAKSGQIDDLSKYKLDTGGLGPLRLGTPMSQVLANGWGRPTDMCRRWGAVDKITRQGVDIWSLTWDQTRLAEVQVSNRRISTVSGATVGMTLSQLKAIYGTKLQSEARQTNSGPSEEVYFVRGGENEIVFWFDPYQRAGVQYLVARKSDKFMIGGC